ncbi:MAG: DUF4445 domain-containing protein [Clostridia bacterium]|nr:DUF4445 domain-containing protein [Clostridia bacterium]
MYTISLLGEKSFKVNEGVLLLDALVQNGYILPAPCGGNGICGKCKVQLVKGEVLHAEKDENGFVLACKARVIGDITLALPQEKGCGLDEFNGALLQGEKEGLGVALDIGTTTLAACLVDLKTGAVQEKISALNPQGVYGADVLSRIDACSRGKLVSLTELIREKTVELVEKLAKGKPIEELVVAANTTMLHLFMGVDPTPIGVAPFTPVFTAAKEIEGACLGLPTKKVRLLPSISAYVGADITAGALACEMGRGVELLVDVGTNGELLLFDGKSLCAASTAAGPALEGACMDCGIGGVSGAIDKVFIKDGELAFTTVDNAPAKGICGSGYIDLIAVLMQEGLIDETGAWDEDSDSSLLKKLDCDKFYLTSNIYLSQRDIRQFQLAKSAIRAGIETLLSIRNLTPKSLDKLYIAGGLGYYMNVKNAAAVGLLPPACKDKAQAVGNTSLAGARLCLLQEGYNQKAAQIAGETQTVELSFSQTFQELYVEHMALGK